MTMNPKTFDKALEIEASVTRTATGSATGVAFSLTPEYPYNDTHKEDLHVMADVSAVALGGGTAVLSVEIDTVANFASPVEVVRRAITAVGRNELIFSLVDAAALEPGAKYIRTTLTITGGTSPSVTYRTFIAKCG